MILEISTVLPSILNFIGTIIIAWGLLITDVKAIELGVARYSSSNDEKNKRLPAVADRIKQRKYATVGLAFLLLGLLLEVLLTFWI